MASLLKLADMASTQPTGQGEIVIRPATVRDAPEIANIVNSYAAGCELARKVDHPAVGALLDTFHMDMVSEDLSCLKGTGHLLKHVHIARTLGRAFPETGDESDYAKLYAALREIGYDDTISIEGNVRQDFAKEATAALKYLRSAL